MNSCFDLTVDICVLMSGSNIGNKDFYQTSFALMKKMKSKKGFYLAVDERGKLGMQYYKKLKYGTYGHHWITEMISKKKIKKIPWSHINKAVRVSLRGARFPIQSEDFNYVVTASGTSCKYLVSHDPHYSNRACLVLRRRLGISVKTASECQGL